MVWASCWETQAEILLNQALRSQTQNNLQHTDKNNDPFAVVKPETIPWMLTNTKKPFLQMKWGNWSQEITLDEDLEMAFHFFSQ